MNIVVSAREMRDADAKTINEFMVPSLVLMERAAVSVCDYIQGSFPKARKIGICCGTGNNGGDGLAIARILYNRGLHVEVCIIGAGEHKMSEDCRRQYEILKKYNISEVEELHALTDADVFVDALFGTGLSREVTGEFANAINQINTYFHMPVVSVDIASGIDATSGQVLGAAVRADVTVSFAFIKRGQLLYPGRMYTGRLSVAEIGISTHSFKDVHFPHVWALTKSDIATCMPARMKAGNKGTFGKVLCICGSKNMAGAAVLSAKAALKCGCGMVKVLTDECNRTIVQQAFPEGLLSTYENKIKEDAVSADIAWADIVLIGPGLSTSKTAKQLVSLVLKNAAVPIVMDADALNIIAEDVDVLRRPHTDIVVTPHVAEMSRLCKESVAYIKEHSIDVAEEFARDFSVHCVLKDATTITTVPFADTFLNMTGNHAMATAGSGDVLSGMIAGLSAQGLKLSEAAPLAVWLHGKAGDMAAKELSAYAVTATDLLNALSVIFQKYAG